MSKTAGQRHRTLSYGSVENQNQNGSRIIFKEIDVVLGGKTILKRVSGMASAGENVAVMGPSGAGKSTLLSVLAARIPISSGCVTLNGLKLTRTMRRKISYVPQTDCFYPELTLRETLTFSTLLRLPDSLSHETKIQHMHEIIDALELNKCLDTKMGTGVNFINGGLSGGERKRTSIACELISNPKLLLLDEPTSGLDSAIAHGLMVTLSRYAKDQHKTIITTIHQPSSQIFHMFSTVLLLFEGEVAYFGPTSKIIDFFSNIGLHADPLANPADFILDQVKAGPDVVAKILNSAYAMRNGNDWPKELQESRRVLDTSVDQLTNSDTNKLIHSSPSERSLSKVKFEDDCFDDCRPSQPGFLTQYVTLTKRCFILAKSRFITPLSFVHLANMLIIGFEWFQIAREEATMTDRLGVIFFTNTLTELNRLHSSLNLIYDVPGVFERERSAGIYRLGAYHLAIVTAEFPFTMFLTTCYAVVCYWLSGLMPAVLNFLVFWLLLTLGNFVAQAMGILFGILIHKRDFATMISTTVMIVFAIAAGFYNSHPQVWVDWIKYVSFFAYCWSGMVKNDLIHGTEFKCNPPNMTSFPEFCKNGTTFPGMAYIRLRNLNSNPIYTDVLALCIMLLLVHLISYFFLCFLKPRPRT